jgi:ribonuclease T
LGKEHQQASDCEEPMTNPGGKVREVYVSVDIEAAGPIPSAFSMLSLGAVVVDDPRKTFYVELKPVNDKFVPDAMKVVGRALHEFAKSGREPKEAMTAFRDWLLSMAKAATPVFVGFNATFDWAFVNFYFHQYLGENPFGFGGIDIKSYYMGMTGCAWEDTRSSRIRSDLKGPSPHTHNALDDAVEQAEMFRRMMKKATGT